jgi:hypothetical protein
MDNFGMYTDEGESAIREMADSIVIRYRDTEASLEAIEWDTEDQLAKIARAFPEAHDTDVRDSVAFYIERGLGRKVW